MAFPKCLTEKEKYWLKIARQFELLAKLAKEMTKQLIEERRSI